MSPFQEYPKKMHHPEHQPAVWKQLDGAGKGLFAPDTVCTQVERFADVVVTTIDQEKYYAARGYRPNNIPDQAAYEAAILEAQPSSGYVHKEFPKWKYHALEIPVIVKSKDEENALGDGWHDAPVIATEDDLVANEPVVAAEPAAVVTQKKAAPKKSKKPAKKAAPAQHAAAQ